MDCSKFETGVPPLEIPDAKSFERLGEIIARLHLNAEKYKKPDFYERIVWNEDETFTLRNNYHFIDYRGAKIFTEEDKRVLYLVAYKNYLYFGMIFLEVTDKIIGRKMLFIIIHKHYVDCFAGEKVVDSVPLFCLLNHSIRYLSLCFCTGILLQFDLPWYDGQYDCNDSRSVRFVHRLKDLQGNKVLRIHFPARF